MTRQTRPISWIKAARKDFEKFPVEAQDSCLAALVDAAEGGKSGIAKPLHGLGTGVMEIALPHHGNAFRVVYALQLAVPSGCSCVPEEVDARHQDTAARD